MQKYAIFNIEIRLNEIKIYAISAYKKALNRRNIQNMVEKCKIHHKKH